MKAIDIVNHLLELKDQVPHERADDPDPVMGLQGFDDEPPEYLRVQGFVHDGTGLVLAGDDVPRAPGEPGFESLVRQVLARGYDRDLALFRLSSVDEEDLTGDWEDTRGFRDRVGDGLVGLFSKMSNRGGDDDDDDERD